MKKLGRFLVVSSAAICALGTMTSCNKTGFKVGLLCIHGQTATYDYNFIKAFEDVCKEFDLKEGEGYEIRTDVGEDYNQIYAAAKEWAEDGFGMIFADSFGHQYGLIDVAREYPKTDFCLATGTNAISTGGVAVLPNYHTAFASIYQGRYLAGVAAGAKMLEDIENKVYPLDQAKFGYVGAWPYAEMISGYTPFYLGACSVFDAKYHDMNHRPKLYVKYTYSWYDYGAEKEAAFTLINEKKCKLISQDTDSMGVPQACAAENIPNISYNMDTLSRTPKTYLYGSTINWRPYFRYVISAVKDKYEGKSYSIDVDKTGTLEDGSVEMLCFGKDDIATEAVKDAVNKQIDDVNNKGAEYVFDCGRFTVSASKNKTAFDGDPAHGVKPYIKTKNDKREHATVIEYYADVIDDGTHSHDTQVIFPKSDGSGIYFAESQIEEHKLRSSPFFDLIVDGIEIVE